MLHPVDKNLYLAGLMPSGMPRTLVDIPGYWENHRNDQHRGGPGEIYLEEVSKALVRSGHGIVGLVVLDQIDNASGKVLSRLITHNVMTDAGINAMLKLYGTGPATSALGQYLALDTTGAYAVQGGSTISSGAQTSITVVGNTFTGGVSTGNAGASFQAAASNNGTGQNVTTPGTAPDATYGTGIVWSYGSANAEYVSGTTGSATSTSIPITSYTVTKSHAAGDYVVAGPSCKDGPSTAPTGMIVGLAAATTTYTTGSGNGNRKSQLVYTFAAGSYTNGTYSSLWVVTFSAVGSYAASGCYAHLVGTPQVLSSSASVQGSYTAII